MSGTLSVVIVDELPLVTEALKQHLCAVGGFDVVATANDSDKGFFEIVERLPDLVIMDVELPGRGAISVVEQISARLPATRVVFYTQYVTDVFLDMALRMNVSGIVHKAEPLSLLATALRSVGQGTSFYSPRIIERFEPVPEGLGYVVKTQSYLSSLTLRQLQVLRHLVRGASVKEVAKAMILSERAIESHKYRIMQKLGIHDRVELARYAIREGLMPA